uniref:NADH-ubiquinone oxidoreductase chain 6 n=1 Tax=Physomerus sp. TaxID=2931302 RepID=A0A8T9ZXJ0_9HEMI|nr:NADH dehydrogenase subunit 6 [Physomerus sp.]
MVMISIMMATLSFIFMWLKHPISMGITIIVQTMMMAMLTGLIMKSFWFSYIVMITMLSGMLVLFIYMASVASNEKLQMSNKLISLTVLMLLLSMMAQLMTENYEDELMSSQTMTTETLSLNSLMNMKFKNITMMMVMYLLFTMITVSHIVNITEGPLRMKK